MKISAHTNISRMTAQRAFREARFDFAQAAQRLATGKRINRGSDDPSGLIGVSNLAARRNELASEIKGFERQQLRINAFDGAASEIGSLLIELESLTVSAANTGAQDENERRALQQQTDAVLTAIEVIENNTTFEGRPVVTEDRSVRSLVEELRSGSGENLEDGDLEGAQKSVESAISANSVERAKAGAESGIELDALIRAKSVELENTVAAQSQIEDADFAEETSNLIRAQLLERTSLEAMRIAQDQQESVIEALIDSVKPEEGDG